MNAIYSIIRSYYLSLCLGINNKCCALSWLIAFNVLKYSKSFCFFGFRIYL